MSVDLFRPPSLDVPLTTRQFPVSTPAVQVTIDHGPSMPRDEVYLPPLQLLPETTHPDLIPVDGSYSCFLPAREEALRYSGDHQQGNVNAALKGLAAQLADPTSVARIVSQLPLTEGPDLIKLLHRTLALYAGQSYQMDWVFGKLPH